MYPLAFRHTRLARVKTGFPRMGGFKSKIDPSAEILDPMVQNHDIRRPEDQAYTREHGFLWMSCGQRQVQGLSKCTFHPLSAPLEQKFWMHINYLHKSANQSIKTILEYSNSIVVVIYIYIYIHHYIIIPIIKIY